MGSRPTRACELKWYTRQESNGSLTSRPTRACELKLRAQLQMRQKEKVTPHAGV